MIYCGLPKTLAKSKAKKTGGVAYRGIVEEEESRWKVGEVGDCVFWVSLCYGEENTREQCPKQDSRPVHRGPGVDVVDDDDKGSTSDMARHMGTTWSCLVRPNTSLGLRPSLASRRVPPSLLAVASPLLLSQGCPRPSFTQPVIHHVRRSLGSPRRPRRLRDFRHCPERDLNPGLDHSFPWRSQPLVGCAISSPALPFAQC